MNGWLKRLEVTSITNAGFAQSYRLDGVDFSWDDWVLVRIKWDETNVEHSAIMSHVSVLRNDVESATCRIMNPTYEEMNFRTIASNIHSIKACSVIDRFDNVKPW